MMNLPHILSNFAEHWFHSGIFTIYLALSNVLLSCYCCPLLFLSHCSQSCLKMTRRTSILLNNHQKKGEGEVLGAQTVNTLNLTTKSCSRFSKWTRLMATNQIVDGKVQSGPVTTILNALQKEGSNKDGETTAEKISDHLSNVQPNFIIQFQHIHLFIPSSKVPLDKFKN